MRKAGGNENGGASRKRHRRFALSGHTYGDGDGAGDIIMPGDIGELMGCGPDIPVPGASLKITTASPSG